MATRTCCLLILTVLGFAADTTAAISLRIVSSADLSLPVDARALDVRWASPTEVYVSLGKQGAVRMPLDGGSRVPVMPPADRGGFFLSSRLAVGQKHLVVASPFGGYAWVPLDSRVAKVEQRGLPTVMDIDARGDVVSVLGADTGDVQGLARDGVIAWTGSLSKGLADMRPLMKGRSKPGGKDMARCGFLDTGAIRFMLDGSVVVVPGVEPGVYRYDERGKLLQTWDTEPLGIVDDCDIEEEERMLLGRDFARRTEWLASRVTVDDILPLRAGPALVLRKVERNVTKWDIVTLPFQGKSERIALPVTISTPRGHLRGAVRGDRLVLLSYESPLPRQKEVVAPRLTVLSIIGQ